MARPAQVRTMGWRVPRAARGLGTEVGCVTVPSPRRTTTVLWGGEGGPGADARVQAALSRRSTAPGRWCRLLCRLLCARAPCCTGSVPGRRTPAHICAQGLSCCGCVGWSRGGQSCRWSIRQPRPHGAIRTSTTTHAGRRHRVAHALGAVTTLTGSTASLQTKHTSPSGSMSNTTTTTMAGFP
jgi:hypothetical protein